MWPCGADRAIPRRYDDFQTCRIFADCLKAGASCGRWQGGGPGHVRDKARAPRMGVAAKRQRAKPD
jgi:hypothetical protein